MKYRLVQVLVFGNPVPGGNHGWGKATVWHVGSEKCHPLAAVFQYKRDIFEVVKTVNALLRIVRYTLRLPFQNT